MRFFMCLFLLMGLLFAGSFEANAQVGGVDPADIDSVQKKQACAEMKDPNRPNQAGLVDDFISSGGAICPCTDGVWIERIIECFTSESYGIVPEVMKSVLRGPPSSGPGSNMPSYKDFSNAIIYGTILLAVTLFGLSMIMGSIQSLPKESFVLVLKVGGVILFFSQFESFYISVLEILRMLVNIVGEAAGEIGNICGKGTNDEIPNIWARWDCLFSKFLGFVGGYAAAGIIGFISSWFFKGGVGVAMFFGIGYVIMTILLMAMRIVYSYIVAIVAVSFIYLLAPLFVPMIFFGQTYQKFATWLKLMLAYLLQPMLLALFSILVLTALEFTIFVGPTSLYAAITGNSNINESKTFASAISGATGTLAGAVTGSQTDWTRFVVKRQIFDFTQHTDEGHSHTNPNLAGGVAQTDDGYVNTSTAPNPDSSHESGFKVDVLDVDRLADGLNVNDKVVTATHPDGSVTTHIIPRKDVWLFGIITQVITSAVLVFILYSLILAVPEITSDLVVQTLKGFGGVTSQRMIGESEIRKSLEGSKEAVKRGKESGDHQDAVRGVFEEMMTGRKK